MSPILVRPVREQLEHDRIIRLLHAKFRRKYDAGMNPGGEQNSAVGTGPTVVYPDLVLLSQDRGHKLQAIVEVETGESVNHLEALAQWTPYSKLRAAFHLYVPAGMVDVARRLSEDNNVHATEIWSYHIVGDQPRFTLVHRSREVPSMKGRPESTVTTNASKPAAKLPANPVPKPVSKPATKAAPKSVAKAAATKKAAKPQKAARSSKSKKPAQPAKAIKGSKKKTR